LTGGRGAGPDVAPDPDGRAASRPAPVIVVVADDLIWSTRLADALRRAGAEPRVTRTLNGLDAQLADAEGSVVDLTARAYDGVAAIAAATRAGVPVIAVGQHDDATLRRAATEAGATRVYAYRRLFEHGDRDLATWVDGLATASPPAIPADRA